LNLTAQEILFLQNKVAYIRDEQCYKKLFFHFNTSLYRLSLNITQDKAVAEDIVSDVMMKIWMMGSRLAQIENLKIYLLTAVKNAALTHLATKKPVSFELDDAVEISCSDTMDTPEKILLGTEVAQKIEAAILSLPPKCQLVFRLIKEEGLSYKEVSKVLEISQNTIETHMRMAFKKIRVDLESFLL